MKELLQQLAAALTVNVQAQQAAIEAQQQIAQVLAAIADSERTPGSEWIDKREAAKLLECHPEQLRRYRPEWLENVHYRRINSRVTEYNGILLLDWKANRHDRQTHDRNIEKYLLKKAG